MVGANPGRRGKGSNPNTGEGGSRALPAVGPVRNREQDTQDPSQKARARQAECREIFPGARGEGGGPGCRSATALAQAANPARSAKAMVQFVQSSSGRGEGSAGAKLPASEHPAQVYGHRGKGLGGGTSVLLQPMGNFTCTANRLRGGLLAPKTARWDSGGSKDERFSKMRFGGWGTMKWAGAEGGECNHATNVRVGVHRRAGTLRGNRCKPGRGRRRQT